MAQDSPPTLTEQATAIADQYLQQAEDGITDLAPSDHAAWGSISRDPDKIRAILAMSATGKTQTEIAETYGITQPTVSKLLRAWEPVADLAERKAKASSVEAVDALVAAFTAAIATGKHGPMETVLKVAGLLRPDADGGGPRVVVQIGVRDGDVQVSLSPTNPQQLGCGKVG